MSPRAGAAPPVPRHPRRRLCPGPRKLPAATSDFRRWDRTPRPSGPGRPGREPRREGLRHGVRDALLPLFASVPGLSPQITTNWA